MELELIPYSFGTTVACFVTFIGLVLAFYLRAKREEVRTVLMTSTTITVATFGVVLFLQTLYISLAFFLDIEDSSFFVFLIIDKLAEMTSSLIIYHFVLELLPLLVFLESTNEAQTALRLRRYRWLYSAYMSVAVVNSAYLLITRAYTYSQQDYTSISRSGFISSTVKFCLDVGIIAVFLDSAWRLQSTGQKVAPSV